jgi:small conductance mechanosensitive channel
MASPSAPQSIHDGFALVGQKLDGWVSDLVLLIPNLIGAMLAALVFLGLAWLMAFAVRHAVNRSGRHDLARMLASFVFWFVLFLGFLVVITILLPSMQPVDIFASLGIGSVALGFAFKDILQNWIAGFFILIRRPFHRGDQIKVGEIEGTVQAVETRATLVKTYGGSLVIIPNSDIYTRSVTVNTAYANRRSEIVVPVGMEADLDLTMTVFRDAILEVEHVLADPPPDVLPWEFKDNNVSIRVRWWTKSQRTYEDSHPRRRGPRHQARQRTGRHQAAVRYHNFLCRDAFAARARQRSNDQTCNKAAIDRAGQGHRAKSGGSGRRGPRSGSGNAEVR